MAVGHAAADQAGARPYLHRCARNALRHAMSGAPWQRRTRRSASTIGGAASDTIIARAAADRAGARPYRAARCENASKCATPDRAGARPVARERVLTMREERSARGAYLSYHPVSVSGAKPRRTVFSVTTRGNMQLRR